MIRTLFSTLVLVAPVAALAQTSITVDTTLPADTTGLIGAEPDGTTFVIGEEHGVRSGNNLFHSFDNFDVGSGDTANFRPDVFTDNIITRANAASTINGRLQTQVPSGAGNLFLLNPFGILFGPDATLDVQGSFHASTADVLRFQDGAAFAATPTPGSVLSATSPIAFGFLGTPIGTGIQVAGSNLEVPDDRELSLVSHAIDIVGGQPEGVPDRLLVPQLRAGGDQGRVRLVSVASAEDVSLAGPFDPFARTGDDFALPAGRAGTLQLRGGAFVEGTEVIVRAAESAGLVGVGEAPSSPRDRTNTILRGVELADVETPALSLDSGGRILSDQSISIEVGTLAAMDRVNFSVGVDRVGGSGVVIGGVDGVPGGVIDIVASESVTLTGFGAGVSAEAASSFTGGEEPGQILIETPVLRLDGGGAGGAAITTRTGRANDAGLIRLDVETLELSDTSLIESSFEPSGVSNAPPGKAGSILIGGFDGARYDTRTVALDNASIVTLGAEGSIDIVASESVRLENGSRISASNNILSLGGSGSIRIETAALELGTTSSISSETRNAFSAGDIDIVVDSLSMSNRARISSSSVPFIPRLPDCVPCADAVAAGPVPIEEAPHGDAGAIRIEAASAGLDDGASIETTTNGSGDAGTIVMDVGTLSLASGARIASTSDTSGGFAFSDPSRTPYYIEPGGGPVSEVLPGAAGSILIGDVAGGRYSTGTVSIVGSTISTRGEQGPEVIAGEDPLVTEARREGNITINATDLVLIENGSEITASVGTGLGGSVRIGDSVAPEATVLRSGSAITAQATGEDGMGGVAGRDQGGRIEITSDVIFRSADTVISADAGTGASGIVEINSPEVNVESGIAQLPTDFLNASSLIRPTCAAQAGGEQSSFSVASRRGVASSPEEMLVAYDAAGESAASGLEGGLPQIASAPGATIVASSAAANTAFRGGHFEEASEGYAELAERLAGEGDPVSRGSALRNLAQSQQAMGRYATSVETLRGALALAEETGDKQGAASALGSLGNAHIALGRAEEAEALLSRGMVLAKSEGDTKLAAGILNNLGNLHAAQEDYSGALASYEESATLAAQSGQPVAEAKALANAARAAVDAGQTQRAIELLQRAESRSQQLASTHDQIYLWIHQARTWEQLSEVEAQRESGLLGAHGALQRAAALAQQTKNERALSFAEGNLGALYQQEHRTNEALYLTRKALRSAERADAPESEYRWHWQEGQLLWAQGRTNQAIASYRRAVAILEDTRQEAQGQYGSAAAYFRSAVAPVYLDLVEALLESSERVGEAGRSERLLRDARGTVEQLKAAELRDYFRNECVAELASKTTTLESASASASIVYPIVLPKRLELLVSTASGLTRHTVEVDAKTLAKTVSRFRAELGDSRSDAWRKTSEQLYDWLVRPYAGVIAAEKIDTLVFVPDGVLRTIPMAALSDGKTVVGAQYALAVTPSLDLVDPQPLAREDVRMLSGGVSEAVGGFPALAMVPRELEAVHKRYGGDVLLDEDFQLTRVEEKIAESQPSIVHIASHAVFTGEPETSFLLTHDDKLTMERLSGAIGVTKFREKPLELLVLSACETAAGDDRAGLGLAGVAIRAGARSAVGSLWSIADEAAFQLVDEFYRQLEDPQVSKAVALQRAQTKLRESERFAHPYYWSPFLMINNWL